MSTPSRALYNLRGVVIIIVMAFHSFLAYLASLPPVPRPFNDPSYAWRAFPIIDGERWFGFDLFCALQDIYLISLMFFLSGLFVWPSLMRKGSGLFLRDRLVRIGLPFAFGIVFLMPIAHYPIYRVTAVDPSIAAYWEHLLALPFWPIGPLWFLGLLFIFDVLAGILFALAPRAREALPALLAQVDWNPRRFATILLSVSALAYIPLALAFGPWEWINIGPIGFQLSRPLHFVVYFFAGVGVGAYGLERGVLSRNGFLARHWRAAVAAGLGGYVTWLGTAGLAMRFPFLAIQVLQYAVFVVACAAGVFAALALSLRFAERPFPALDPLSENAYGIYLVHYDFVVWLQYLLLGVGIFAFAKGMMVFAGTVLLSLGAVAAIGCIPVAKGIIGMDRPVASRTR
jgi:glucans biosynthesis protein C